MQFFLFALVQCLLSIPVAYFIGRSRRIGFYWSLFFCCTFSLIVGCFIIFLSSKKTKETYLNMQPWITVKIYLGICSFATGLYLFFSNYRMITEESPYLLVPCIGLWGLGIFLMKIVISDQYNS
jgi:hypothetical protein